MPNFIIRKPWDLPQRLHTPEAVYKNQKLHRRELLKSLGLGAIGLAGLPLLAGCNKGTDQEIKEAGVYDPVSPAEGEKTAESKGPYPAKRNEKFEYGRPETEAAEAARYTNFYEFTMLKDSWRHVGRFKPAPWSVEVGGLCRKPRTFDLDELHSEMPLEERHYRHRCVETWAMCVPWTGFPLRDLLALVEPESAAKFVAFETFNRPNEASNMGVTRDYPWPYTEGLTLDEANNELTLLATGIYGERILKQHGAPIRLVVPWKYGFKSIKSIVKITLTDQQPATFWNTIQPVEYDFEANVNPGVPHPRWSQENERMLGTGARFPTVIYNGYGDYVAKMYDT
jgi:methionine sulfoxide reductase catalytic subunit